jgi:hypothetical protein
VTYAFDYVALFPSRFVGGAASSRKNSEIQKNHRASESIGSSHLTADVIIRECG